jgi:hypothetical protein
VRLRDDDDISHVHACLLLDEQGLYLDVTLSRCGTLVGGRPVRHALLEELAPQDPTLALIRDTELVELQSEPEQQLLPVGERLGNLGLGVGVSDWSCQEFRSAVNLGLSASCGAVVIGEKFAGGGMAIELYTVRNDCAFR